jgi:hypothetical protein
MYTHAELAVLANLAYTPPGPDPKRVFDSVATSLPIDEVFFTETSVDAEMYTLVLPRFVIFLCRGTESMTDVGVDLMVFKTKCRAIPGAKIHRGFARQYASLAPTISKQVQRFAEFAEDEMRSVLFIGHSLGGALATIGAALVKKEFSHLYVQCVSFGCPRVGNKAFADFFNAHVDHHTRYVNGNDIITRVPRINYTHVGNECKIGASLGKSGCASRYFGTIRDHSMEEYIAAFQTGGGTEKDRLLDFS